ncbi:MAG TPA: DJ-1/PfpI family protein [Candidatus Bathyarchaeia archaeon]|nr:DJ-1/PfpI family protein [Candidatus Bathyarchaeia archaeon]
MKFTKSSFLAIFLIIYLFSAIPSKHDSFLEVQSINNVGFSQMEIKSLEDMKVLLIIGTYFGDSYFWLKTQFEAFGCNVTTAGTSSLVPSCPNKPQRPVAPNISVYDMTREIIQEFDCVIIPSGAHWTYLIINNDVHDILNIAYEEGLVVGGLCIGTLVLAYADDLVAGKKVCYYSGSYSKMTQVGAEIIYGSGVVSDQRLVTGGTGAYNTINVNVYPFSVAISKAVLGLSGITNIEIAPSKGSINETYTLSAETSDLTNIFGVNYTNTIDHLKGTIHSEDEEFEDKTVYLYDLDEDNKFVANYTSTAKGPFSIDFEIEGDSYGIEIIRNAIDFKIRSLPGFNWLITIPALFGIVGITKIIKSNKNKRK